MEEIKTMCDQTSRHVSILEYGVTLYLRDIMGPTEISTSMGSIFEQMKGLRCLSIEDVPSKVRLSFVLYL
jgi:hypothetical protein